MKIRVTCTIFAVYLNFCKCLLTDDTNSDGNISDESVNDEIENEIKNMTSREANLYVRSFKRGYKSGHKKGFGKGFDAGIAESENEPDIMCGVKHLSAVIKRANNVVDFHCEGKISLYQDAKMIEMIERILPNKTLDNKDMTAEQKKWLQIYRDKAKERARKWMYYLKKFENGIPHLTSGLYHLLFPAFTFSRDPDHEVEIVPAFCGTVAACEQVLENLLTFPPRMSETYLEDYLKLENRIERYHNTTMAAVYESPEFKDILLNQNQYRLLKEDLDWIRKLRFGLKFASMLDDRHGAYHVTFHTIGKDEEGREIRIPFYDKLSGCGAWESWV